MDIFRRDVATKRKRVADRLQNPRIKAITFRALRHFKATVECHECMILHLSKISKFTSLNAAILFPKKNREEGLGSARF